MPEGTRHHDRRGHPLALHLWNQLRNRCEADRRLVFEACKARLGIEELPARQEQAAEALRRFIGAQNLERSRSAPAHWAVGDPSRRRYDEFRASQIEPRAWPSSQFIRNAFAGDWNAGLAAVGARPPVDVLSRRLTARGFAYTREEVLDALLLWISEVDRREGASAPLRQSAYCDWARDQRRSADPLLPRFPTIPVIRDLVGLWHEVLVDLGHVDRMASAQRRQPDSSPEPAANFDIESTPPDVPRRRWHDRRGSSAAYKRADALVAWVAWVAAQLPEEDRSGLTGKRYAELIASVRRVSLAQGRPVRPPSLRMIESCLEIGGWNHAKQKAGLLDPGLSIRRRNTRAFSEEELLLPLLQAVAELGPEMSRAAYTRWRKKQLDDPGAVISLAQTNPQRRIPSDSLLLQRFGDGGRWQPALEAARRRASALGSCLDSSPRSVRAAVDEIKAAA